jgi:hypothetical protein
MLYHVYIAVAWQRVDQICYNIHRCIITRRAMWEKQRCWERYNQQSCGRNGWIERPVLTKIICHSTRSKIKLRSFSPIWSTPIPYSAILRPGWPQALFKEDEGQEDTTLRNTGSAGPAVNTWWCTLTQSYRDLGCVCKSTRWRTHPAWLISEFRGG